MHVKSLMIPFSDLQVVRNSEPVGAALNRIKDNNLLSLPVVDDHDVFVGVLSRRYVFEEYFNGDILDKEEFLQLPVHVFMKTKLPVTAENIYVEEAAFALVDQHLTFLPIVDEINGKLIGIITSSLLLQKYRDIYGFDYPKLIIYVYDFKGKLAQIAGIISKAGGNIKNIVQTDVEVMGFQEISLRVDAKDIQKVVKQLEAQGFEVREFSQE